MLIDRANTSQIQLRRQSTSTMAVKQIPSQPKGHFRSIDRRATFDHVSTAEPVQGYYRTLNSTVKRKLKQGDAKNSKPATTRG